MPTPPDVQARLIDGKALAQDVRREVRGGVDAWTAQGHRAPYLAVVLVGDNPASHAYVRGKTRAAGEAGIESDTLTYPADVGQKELMDVVARLNGDADVDGILVQLPLPDHLDADAVVQSIHPDKDVDGLTHRNAGRLVVGAKGFVPATPAGVAEMLRRSGIETSGRHAVVVGRSNLVGKPLANLLLRRGTDATVTVCHSRTSDLGAITRQADILVAAIGRAHFVTAEMVKEGAAVIDVGINRVEDASRERGYRLVGDVDFEGVGQKAGYLTPVPGGVGPMTIAMLLKNTLQAARGLDENA